MLDVKLGTHSNVTVNRMDLGIEYKQVKPTLPTACSTLHHLPRPPLVPPYTTCPTHLLFHPTPLAPPTSCSTLHHLPHPPLAPPYTTCPTHLLLHPTPLAPPTSCSTLHHLPRPSPDPPTSLYPPVLAPLRSTHLCHEVVPGYCGPPSGWLVQTSQHRYQGGLPSTLVHK